ncbi:MAG: protein-export chaperone SecB [Clostridia bacterium]|nr:protein-export chaperone SecB [Clostridia bacterium]
MEKLQLLAHGVSEIHFENKQTPGAKMQLSHRFAYNVGYSKDETCRAQLEVSVSDKERPDLFAIKAVLFGIFRYDASLSREEIHKSTFRELYPYARALVTTVSVNTGLPPVYLASVDIDTQSVYRVEMDPRGRPAEE